MRYENVFEGVAGSGGYAADSGDKHEPPNSRNLLSPPAAPAVYSFVFSPCMIQTMKGLQAVIGDVV